MKNTTLCGKILHFVVNYSFLWYNITFCSTFVVYLWYICDIFVVFFAMGHLFVVLLRWCRFKNFININFTKPLTLKLILRDIYTKIDFLTSNACLIHGNFLWECHNVYKRNIIELNREHRQRSKIILCHFKRVSATCFSLSFWSP